MQREKIRELLESVRDGNVPPEDAFDTVVALWAAGNRDVELRLLPGGNHSFQFDAEDFEIYEDGQPVAYVQTEGESFERRPLGLGATDGSYTLVERGVEAGEYVVTTGAYQVYLASLSTGEIGDHGHPH